MSSIQKHRQLDQQTNAQIVLRDSALMSNMVCCIRVDFIDLAKQIQEQMISAAQTQEAMEFEHQEAMLRFDEVRRQYLGQKGIQTPETPILK